ncbi:hypothetical protein [Maritalea porphyrae]|uniref:Uncharacterized protein n=1 Tax=Maritalea porphyrae TaxID=880732 RepID=A0ABQ5UM41_9HYPH|nr:hypothetical protein [Maritalea porphyrae]GLQ16279.1 hypothetical protein GCM10007879_05280 [Maritalea porphyrae]
MGDQIIPKPISHQVGMSLEGMPAEELDARLVMLFDEMKRVKAALELVRPHEEKKVAKKDEVFKNLFPMLSNPDANS